ncbi:MAG: hypothetical protein KGJ89_01400 [Patescibacteria group bacterium]|nr:hypothetical protein [Patescibacteria group bacterium]MDE2226596.1 hypothetical protein [Patescibacteria group bacterium]
MNVSPYEEIKRMEEILEVEGYQKAAIYAHRLPEPTRMTCLQRLRSLCLADIEMPVGVIVPWIDGIIAGRIK